MRLLSLSVYPVVIVVLAALLGLFFADSDQITTSEAVQLTQATAGTSVLHGVHGLWASEAEAVDPSDADQVSVEEPLPSGASEARWFLAITTIAILMFCAASVARRSRHPGRSRCRKRDHH